jgi:hypothetical protein
MIRFFCPTCRAKIQAPDDNAGRTGRCPACQNSFVVPAASAAELAETFATGLAGEIPAIPAPSNRPASPIEIFGNGQTPATMPPPPPIAQVAQPAPPTAQTNTRRINDREAWEEPEEQEQSATLPPPLPQRPKVSTGWLPLALAGAGALLILITIIVGVMGRNTSKSVAVDPSGNALPDQTQQKPKHPVAIIPTIPTTLPVTQPAIAPPTRDPLVIASRASGEKQPVNDPPPQIKNPTTRPVAAAKQFKTAPSLVTPVAVNENVYFCAKDGSFYVLNTDTLDVTDKKRLIEPVQRLIRDGNKLKAESLQPTPQTAIEFDSAIDGTDPQDMDPSGAATRINGKSIPLKFRQHLFAEKQLVSYQDKLFRPTSGGTIRILENGKITEYKSEVVGMGLWRIALLPQGPMGYDNTSVYELDEHLCPTRRLINVDPDVGRWSQAHINSFLASNEKTLCFVSAYNNKARMMIWSPHGSKKFREVPVTYNETATTEGNRLLLLGDGYLFCGGEITWLPIGEGAPVRFTPKPAIPVAEPSLQARRRASVSITSTAKVQNFTPPMLVNDKIFVGHASGSIYIFHTSLFTGATDDGTRSADTNP